MNIEWAQLIKDIQPYMSIVGSVLSLAVLGFIARLYYIVKEAQEERIKAVSEQKRIVEERLENTKSDLERTEKWYDRKVQELKDQLMGVFETEGITTHNLFTDPVFVTNLRADIRETVKSVLAEMTELQEEFEERKKSISDPDWHIQMAKASAVADNWPAAAAHYGEYLKDDEENWEVHFLRGVAYANYRGSNATDLAGVRSYNEAIAFCPDDVDKNIRARLHTYRGALLKRLNRLDEAESELLLAQRWATADYEVTDNQYNLACVYAMSEQKEKMLNQLRRLSSSKGFLNGIRNKPYFNNYRDDPDFMEIVG